MEGGGETQTHIYKAPAWNLQTNYVGDHIYRGIGSASDWPKELKGIIFTLQSDLSTQEAKQNEDTQEKEVKRAAGTNYPQGSRKTYKTQLDTVIKLIGQLEEKYGKGVKG